MNASHVLGMAGFQRTYLSLLVDDIPDARMSEQPGAVKNHPAWQIGHLAWAFDGLHAAMTGATPRRSDWAARFGQGSTPISARAEYPSKAELIRAYDDRRGAFAKAIESGSSEFFARPNPVQELAKFGLPTVGHLALFGLVAHECMHLGQLATWRAAAGMPAALSEDRG